MVTWRDLAAVASVPAPVGLRPTSRNVLHHAGVVEALHRLGPTLPVRFGTWLADSDAVARSLDERYGVLVTDLARLGDKVELGVSILWDSETGEGTAGRSDVPPPASADLGDGPGAGTRYLQARLAESRREAALKAAATVVARELDGVLGPLALGHRCAIAPTARLAVRAAYLLDPAHLRDCHLAIEGLRRRRPDVHFLLSGPWPPYSFVSAARPDGPSALGGALDQIGAWLSVGEAVTRHRDAAARQLKW